MVEPLRLVRDAACDLLNVAGDIGKLHAEPADAVGKLVNESFGQCLVGLSVQDRTLHNGHVRAFSSQSRSSAHRGDRIPIPSLERDSRLGVLPESALGRFPAKWRPVRVKKTRQIKI